MGFEWTEITIGTLDGAVHKNKIKTNVDVVYSDLELSQYNWVYLPVSIGDENDNADYQELRTAIDYAKDQNYCRSHNLAHDGDDNAVAKTGDKATVYTGVDSNHNPGHDSTNNPGVDTDYDSNHQGTNRVGVDTGHDSSVYSNQDSGVDEGHEASAVGTYDTGYNHGHNTTYQSGETG